MDKPKKPTHGTPKPGGKDMQSALSQRERDDTYVHVLVNCRDNWRVISGRTGSQWIIQKRSSGTNTGVWLGKCHCTLRDSLIESCSRLGLLCDEVLSVLVELPDHVSGQPLPETPQGTTNSDREDKS